MLRQKTVEPVSKEAGRAAAGADRVAGRGDGPASRPGRERPAADARRARGADSDRGTRPDQPPLRGHRERRPRRGGGRGGQAAGDGRAGPAAEGMGDAQGHSGPRDDAGLPGGARRPAAAAGLPHRGARGRGRPSGPASAWPKPRWCSTPTGPIAPSRCCASTTPPSSSWRFGCPRAPSCGRPAWPASRSSRRRSPGAADPRGVRIPLIKTAPGDLYYEVVLKYGGKMPALGTLGSVDVPADPLREHPAGTEPGAAVRARAVPLVRLRRHDAAGRRRGRSAGRLRQVPDQADRAARGRRCGRATSSPRSARRQISRPNWDWQATIKVRWRMWASMPTCNRS